MSESSPRPNEPLRSTLSVTEGPANIGQIADTSPQSKRNRGAPFRNSNALSRGSHSRHFTRAESAGLDADINGQSIDEIDIARVNILLLAELLKDDKYRSMADVIAGSKGLRYLLECIRSLSREQKSMYQNMTTTEQPPQDLNDICPAED